MGVNRPVEAFKSAESLTTPILLLRIKTFMLFKGLLMSKSVGSHSVLLRNAAKSCKCLKENELQRLSVCAMAKGTLLTMTGMLPSGEPVWYSQQLNRKGERVCVFIRPESWHISAYSRTDCWLRCGTSPVQQSICCDAADQKEESQCSTAETDGRSDTFRYMCEQTGRHLAADQKPSETGGKDGYWNTPDYLIKSMWTPLTTYLWVIWCVIHLEDLLQCYVFVIMFWNICTCTTKNLKEQFSVLGNTPKNYWHQLENSGT